MHEVLFPFKIPVMSKHEIIARIKNYEQAPASFVYSIYEAMKSSKAAEQCINFVLWQKDIIIEYMSLQELKSGAAYIPKERRMIFTEGALTESVILRQFWTAFSQAIHTPNNGTLASCKVTLTQQEMISNYGMYPFIPATLLERMRHYEWVFAVYAKVAKIYDNNVMMGKEFGKEFSSPLPALLRSFLEKQTFANRPKKCSHFAASLQEFCLISQSLYSLMMECYEASTAFKLPIINGSAPHINITNPSLLNQMPTTVAKILTTIEASVKGAEQSPQEVEAMLDQMLAVMPASRAKEIAEYVTQMSTYMAHLIPNCYATLMERSPLIAPIQEQQKLMGFVKAEARKALACNRHWTEEFSAKPGVKLSEVNTCTIPSYWSTGLISTGLGMAVQGIPSMVKRNVSESTYNKLDWYCGKAMRLAGHCSAASYATGTPLIGVMTFGAGEWLVYLHSRYPGLSPTIPSMINNAYSLSGAFYAGYQDVATFAISIVGGVSGQGVMHWYEHRNDQPLQGPASGNQGTGSQRRQTGRHQ